MSGLLDQLGLGSIIPGYEGWERQVGMQAAMQQMQSVPQPMCMHGPNCPECWAIQKRAEFQIRKAARIAAKKKVEYEKRCRIYMQKFRKGGLNGEKPAN